MSIPEPAAALRVWAAGVVALRGTGKRTEALVIHRGDRDDWSLPKGKVDAGERLAATAVRETREETGIDVVLGVPLGTVRYTVPSTLAEAAEKSVNYWFARPTDPAIAAGDIDVPDHWQANREVAEVRWVRVSRLPGLLTYPHDLDVVREALLAPAYTTPFVLLRHAQAERRPDYRARVGEEAVDAERPLTPLGQQQAQAMVQVLSAYGIREVCSSSATRCMETVRPYAASIGAPVDGIDSITEESFGEHPKRGVRDVLDLLLQPRPTVVCIHRPTKNRLVREIGRLVEQEVSLALSPAEYLVFHRSQKVRSDGTIGRMALGTSTRIEYGLHH